MMNTALEAVAATGPTVGYLIEGAIKASQTQGAEETVLFHPVRVTYVAIRTTCRDFRDDQQ